MKIEKIKPYLSCIPRLLLLLIIVTTMSRNYEIISNIALFLEIILLAFYIVVFVKIKGDSSYKLKAYFYGSRKDAIYDVGIMFVAILLWFTNDSTLIAELVTFSLIFFIRSFDVLKKRT